MPSALDDIVLYQPRCGREVCVPGGVRCVGVAVCAFLSENGADLRRYLGMVHERRRARLRGVQTSVSKGVGASQREREREGRAEDESEAHRLHTLSASGASTIARWLAPDTNLTRVTPRTVCSFPAGTTIGPGLGALPGAGCGKAVEHAVWKEMLPSTFCAIWWMCPLRTVTEPKRLR